MRYPKCVKLGEALAYFVLEEATSTAACKIGFALVLGNGRRRCLTPSSGMSNR